MSGFLSGRTSLTTVQTADIADDSVSLAKIASGTDGNIISYDASGNPVAIATGTDGQVLTSAGAGAQPAFEDAAGGGFEALIGSTVISNDASISFTVDTTYDIYKFVIVDCVPATDNVDLWMRFGDSGGIDSGASDYAWATMNHRADNASGGSSIVLGDNDNEDAQMKMTKSYLGGVGSTAGEGCNAIVHVFANETSGGTMFTSYNIEGVYADYGPYGDPAVVSIQGAGMRKAALALTTVQFLFSSGNLSTGRITCFGLKHA